MSGTVKTQYETDYPRAGSTWRCKCGRPACDTTAEVVGWSALIGRENVMLDSCVVAFRALAKAEPMAGPDELLIYHLDEFLESFEPLP